MLSLWLLLRPQCGLNSFETVIDIHLKACSFCCHTINSMRFYNLYLQCFQLSVFHINSSGISIGQLTPIWGEMEPKTYHNKNIYCSRPKEKVLGGVLMHAQFILIQRIELGYKMKLQMNRAIIQ